MAASVRDYYLLPRRTVHALVAALVLLLVGCPLVVWAAAPTWLPHVPAMLDADQPIERPDVVVLKSAGESDEAVREAARLLTAGQVRWIAMLGFPFTPDNLAMPAHSRRYEQLLEQGAPRAS